MSETAERNRAVRNEAAQGAADPPRIKHKYGRIILNYAARLAKWPIADDGPIYMVNLMKYHEVAKYDGLTA